MRRTDRSAADRGSASIYAALMAGLLTAVTGAVLAVGTAVLARHRAGAAADTAALSAAVHADAGETPCDWARRTVSVQNARVVRCACDGTTCVVRAAVGTPWGAAEVTSRAGAADGIVGDGAGKSSAIRVTGNGAPGPVVPPGPDGPDGPDGPAGIPDLLARPEAEPFTRPPATPPGG